MSPNPGETLGRSSAADRHGHASLLDERLSAIAAAATAALVLAAPLVGCAPGPQPEPVVARLSDENASGEADDGETVIIDLDRALAEGSELPEIELAPATAWTAALERASATRLVATLRAPPNASAASRPRARGVHGDDSDATGVRLRWPRRNSEWVDLEFLGIHPRLERALWEEPAGEGNLVVDAEDRLRLVFDRPVELRLEGKVVAAAPIEPGDLRLAKDLDRLDSGEVPSTFLAPAGRDPREIIVELGSAPILTLEGDFDVSLDRGALESPSGIALGGTVVFPSTKIFDLASGRGAVSTREVDLGYASSVPEAAPVAGARLPTPGGRIGHTVNGFPDGRALVVGGRATAGPEWIDQILLFDPAPTEGARHFTMAGRLAEGTAGHTSIPLAGPDGTHGTPDDFIVVAGGRNADLTPLSRVSVIRLVGGASESGAGAREVSVESIDDALVVPRWNHAGVATGPMSILVDGGRRSGLVAGAELIQFRRTEDGRIELDRDASRAFRSVPRTRHTLTALADSGLVLAYGGYGYSAQAKRSHAIGTPIGSSSDVGVDVDYTQGSVLVSPVLLDVRDPAASIVLTRIPFRFSLPRFGHLATLLPPESPSAPPRVLLAGGTSRHPDGEWRWELPLSIAQLRDLAALPDIDRLSELRTPELARLLTRRQVASLRVDDINRLRESATDLGELQRTLRGRAVPIPQPGEAGDALLFELDAASPADSAFEVLPHPSPDPDQIVDRDHAAMVTAPWLGPVLLGGERPGSARGSGALRGGEAYSRRTRTWNPLAIRLMASRTRHSAYLSSRGPVPMVYLIGGETNSDERETIADVEAIPLR